MFDIVYVACSKKSPMAVSGDKINESMPSYTALEISTTSDLEGISLVTIDSMIYVDKITGLPTRLHFLMMYF